MHVRINILTPDYTNWTSECVVIMIRWLSHFSSNMLKLLPFDNDRLSGECSEIKKIKTLKRLLSPYLVISSKKRVCSAWSELAEFRANTSKLQRSTSCEGGGSDCNIDAYLCCVYGPLCDVRFIAQTPGEQWDLQWDGSYPEAVYHRCRLVWYGCRVGPLEHPGIMQCLCWVQLKFRCWHCAANSSQELFIEILQSPCRLWKDVLKREGGSCFTAQGSCLCFLRLWL